MESKTYFKLKNKIDLKADLTSTKILESDFMHITKEDVMMQFEFIDENETRGVEVKAGLHKIIKTMAGLELIEGKFTHDELLNEYNNTEHIEKIIDNFFNNLHLYKEFGIEIPKRNLLLYGPPGTGKTSSLQKTVRKYLDNGNTAVVTWDTSAFEPYEVKEFISRFEYKDVNKIIVIAEDIGGASQEDVRIRSSSSLLRLLDNTDKTFSIPVMIIATTNFITGLSENLANRSGRFDDKIEVNFPDSESRAKLLKFFAKDYATEEVIKLIKTDSCKKFSVAHLKECYIRSRLHSKDLLDVIKEVSKEMEMYHKGYSKQNSVGF